MIDPIVQIVQALGKRYESVKNALDDFRLLTSPAMAKDALDELCKIREELVDVNAAYLLEDGSIIVKSDYIISFLEPNFPHFALSKRKTPDLKNPEIVEKIALTCGLTQWLFLANQIVDPQEKEEFLKTCAQIVADRTRRRI